MEPEYIMAIDNIIKKTDFLTLLFSLLADRPIRTSGEIQWRLEWKKISCNPGNQALLPLLYFSTLHHSINLPPDFIKLLEKSYIAALKKHLLFKKHIAMASEILTSHTIPFRFFKGAELAERLYTWPELRCFKDIDVLVPVEHLDKARHVLESGGWSCVHRDSIHDVLSRDWITLELHHALFGKAESLLYNITPEDTSAFLEQRISPEEEHVLLLLKLFSETVFEKFKLVDIYLYSRVLELDAIGLRQALVNWNALLVHQIIHSVIDSYTLGSRSLWASLYANKTLWFLTKNLMVLIRTRGALEKIQKLICNCTSPGAAGAGGQCLRAWPEIWRYAGVFFNMKHFNRRRHGQI